MEELKVRKFGDSLGVVLPQDVIDRLQVKVGGSLFLIEGPGDSYLLSLHDIVSEKTKDIIDRYRSTLRALAE